MFELLANTLNVARRKRPEDQSTNKYHYNILQQDIYSTNFTVKNSIRMINYLVHIYGILARVGVIFRTMVLQILLIFKPYHILIRAVIAQSV
jgi:hypothetical protein